MGKAVTFEALMRLNNSKLKVLKEIAERTGNGATRIDYKELMSELDCNRHVISYSVAELAKAKLIYFVSGESPDEGMIGMKPNVIVDVG